MAFLRIPIVPTHNSYDLGSLPPYLVRLEHFICTDTGLCRVVCVRVAGDDNLMQVPESPTQNLSFAENNRLHNQTYPHPHPTRTDTESLFLFSHLDALHLLSTFLIPSRSASSTCLINIGEVSRALSSAKLSASFASAPSNCWAPLHLDDKYYNNLCWETSTHTIHINSVCRP